MKLKQGMLLMVMFISMIYIVDSVNAVLEVDLAKQGQNNTFNNNPIFITNNFDGVQNNTDVNFTGGNFTNSLQLLNRLLISPLNVPNNPKSLDVVANSTGSVNIGFANLNTAVTATVRNNFQLRGLVGNFPRGAVILVAGKDNDWGSAFRRSGWFAIELRVANLPTEMLRVVSSGNLNLHLGDLNISNGNIIMGSNLAKRISDTPNGGDVNRACWTAGGDCPDAGRGAFIDLAGTDSIAKQGNMRLGTGNNVGGGNLTIEARGAKVLTIVGDSGNVGIGKLLPFSMLDVHENINSSTITAKVMNTTTGSNTINIESFETGVSDDNTINFISNSIKSVIQSLQNPAFTALILGTITNNDIRFMTNNINKQIITNKGYVGIGDNFLTPTAMLNIQNSSDDLQIILQNTKVAGVTIIKTNLTIKDTTSEVVLGLVDRPATDSSAFLHLKHSSTNFNIDVLETGIGSSIRLSSSHDLILTASTQDITLNAGTDIIFSTDGTDRVIITESDGFLGVLTQTPESALSVIGDINASGNYTGNLIYGHMWFNNESSSGRETIITFQGIFVNVTGFDQDNGNGGQNLNGFDFNNDNALDNDLTGIYQADYSVSFERSSGGASREYVFGLMMNGVLQNNTKVHRATANVNDVGSVSASSIITLTKNDMIHLMVRNEGGTENIGVHNANVRLMRIGD